MKRNIMYENPRMKIEEIEEEDVLTISLNVEEDETLEPGYGDDWGTID